MLEETYAQLAEDEIESVKEYYGAVPSDRDTESDTKETIFPQQVVNNYTDLNDRLGYSSLNGTRTDAINKQKTQYNLAVARSEEDDEEATDEVNPVTEEDRGDDSPYIITEEDFAEGRFDHDKVGWTFYADDGIVADENDEVVDDVEGSIGWGNLDMKYATPDNPHVVYIRNERIDVDYEISVNYGSYKEIVAGIPTVDEMAGKSPRQQQEERMRAKEAAKGDE